MRKIVLKMEPVKLVRVIGKLSEPSQVVVPPMIIRMLKLQD
jgi:hypothetical protein